MRYVLLLAPFILAQCDRLPDFLPLKRDPGPQEPLSATVTPVPEVTEEETPESKDEPAPSTGPVQNTVAGLGDPARAGFWMETPLVSKMQTGRVKEPKSGKWVRVTLLPSGGEPTSGSRLSLQAMQSLDVSPADLIKVEVTIDA